MSQAQLSPINHHDHGSQNLNEFIKLGDGLDSLSKQPIAKPQKQENYAEPEIIDYFESKDGGCKRVSRIDSLVRDCASTIKEQIKAGSTEISKSKKNIADIISTRSKQGEGQVTTSRAKESIDPALHKQFVERMNKARRTCERKRQLKRTYDQTRLEQACQRQGQHKAQEQESKRHQREQLIKQKMQKLQLRKQKNREERIQALKRYKSVVSQKRIHEKMAQNYHNHIIHSLIEERQKKLEERSKRLKGYSIEEIRMFERQYIKKEEERTAQSRKSEDWEYVPPPIHPRLQQLLEEEKLQERLKLEQKRRNLEQRIARKETYAQYLKENIRVKVDPKKREEIEKNKIPKPTFSPSESERLKKGNDYLTQSLKKVKREKKDSYSSKEEPSNKAPKLQKLKSNTSMSHYGQGKTVQELQEKRINRLLSSKAINSSDKLEQLQVEVEKLSERVKRHEEMARVSPGGREDDTDLGMLLSSIKVKIGIMQLYKD